MANTGDSDSWVAETPVLCGRFRLHQVISECCHARGCKLTLLLTCLCLILLPLLLDLKSPQFATQTSHFDLLPKSWKGQPPVLLILHGSAAVLRCHVVGSSGKVVWEHDSHRLVVDDSRIKITDDGSLHISRVLPSDAGRYSCQFENGDKATTLIDVLPPARQSEEPWNVWSPHLPVLLDKYTGGFMHVPTESLCRPSVRVLVFVVSHPLFTEDRRRIRSTWGKQSEEHGVAVVFGVGLLSEKYDSEMIAESQQYGDLVLGNFTDHSLDPDIHTMKLMSAFEYFLKHCASDSGITHLLVVSHRHVVNIPLLTSLIGQGGVAESSRAVYGHLVPWNDVNRHPRHPLYLSLAHYRGYSQPSFIREPVFLVGVDAVSALCNTTWTHPLLHRHDLLVFGFAAERAGVTRVHMENFFAPKTSNLLRCGGPLPLVVGTAGTAMDLAAVSKFADPLCSKPALNTTST